MYKTLKTPQRNLIINSVKLQDIKSIYKKLLYFCILSNGLSEREIKKPVSSSTESKRTKYLGINLTKEIKHVYT